MRIPLAGGQNKRFSVNQDAQTLVNLYLDADSEEPETSPAMYKVPGSRCFPLRNRPYRRADRIGGAVLAGIERRGFTVSTATATRRWSGRFILSPSVGCSKPLSGDIRRFCAWVSTTSLTCGLQTPDYPDPGRRLPGGYFILPTRQPFWRQRHR